MSESPNPNCKLQIDNCKSTWGHNGPAIRLGFRVLKRIKQSEMEKIVAARKRVGRFTSVDHLHKVSGVTKNTIQKLAEADAFGSIAMKRREALWDGLELTDEEMPLFGSDGVTERRSDEGKVVCDARMNYPPPLGGGVRGRGWSEETQAIARENSPAMDADAHHAATTFNASAQLGDSEVPPPTLPSPARGEGPALNDARHEKTAACSPIDHRPSKIPLPPMPLGQEVMTDYATAGLSLKAHPLQLVRHVLREQKIITSAELMATPHGRWVRVAGLVLIRQRPGTAAGIVFVTLEDETGICNLILRENLFERYRAAACQAALLQADGYIERQGQVVHVMAKRLFDRSDLIRGYEFTSRDFH
jgi:DNA polymerase III alpha subunit